MNTSGAIRVLVVEDNSALANVLKFNLEKSGYEVGLAGNGREAWEMLAAAPVDLIISDHQMPEMSGIELCRRVREDEQLHETPFMLVTAKRLEIDLEGLRNDLNVTQTFSKPFSPAAIVSAVRDLMSPAR